MAGHLERLGRPADLSWSRGVVRVAWHLADPPRVTVVIPTRHNRELLSTCLPSLARTDYPSFEVVIVDNGGHTVDHDEWYRAHAAGLDLRVLWWTQPFNYSAVNNLAAAEATGEVLVFLNDDTELRDPGWLTELVGWASQPDIGLVGVQLIGPVGEIQHGGVILGLNGFADHLFQGMEPHSDSLMGPTDWYRNTLSVTAACVAVRREVFERIGGFDERFVLCGSDVVLGLDARFLGLRNVVTPFTDVRHLESATRSTHVPESDFFASYWRYQKWLFGGDPYFSPSLSLSSREPHFQAAHEPTPREMIAGPLRRDFTVFRQVNDSAEASWLADQCRADESVVAGVRALHAEHREPVLAAHRQLVPARDRQPVLRRRGHRSADRRSPGHPPRRAEPVRGGGEPERGVLPLGAGGGVPGHRRLADRVHRRRVGRRPRSAALRGCLDRHALDHGVHRGQLRADASGSST